MYIIMFAGELTELTVCTARVPHRTCCLQVTVTPSASGCMRRLLSICVHEASTFHGAAKIAVQPTSFFLCRLADFGLAEHNDDRALENVLSIAGTPYYLASWLLFCIWLFFTARPEKRERESARNPTVLLRLCRALRYSARRPFCGTQA